MINDGKEKEELVLYHITEATNVSMIQKKGLIPSIGKNSIVCGEEVPCVYLCDMQSLPYWMLILEFQRPILIKVRVKKESISEYHYSKYSEYLVSETIRPEKLSFTEVSKAIKDRMCKVNEDLCCDYIYTIGDLCLWYAQFYSDQASDQEHISQKELKFLTRSTLKAIRGLDYGKVPKSRILNAIQDSGDGRYAFTDYYCNTNERLWSQLPLYCNDDLEALRKELYQFIKDTLHEFLYADTGGWNCDM